MNQAQADAEAHVCHDCGAHGYSGMNCQQCGGHNIEMTEGRSFYEIVEVSDRGRTTWVVEQDGVPVEECPDLPAALRCYRRLRHLNEDNPVIFGERKNKA